MKIVQWMLLLSVTMWANNATVELASVTVTIKGVEKRYAENETFNLAYEEELCLVGGKGMITITKASEDTETLTLLGEEKKVCLTLEKPVEQNSTKSLLQKGKDFVCKSSTDTGAKGLSRKDYEDEESYLERIRAWACE